MTRQPHDQFAKEYLEELLTPLGTMLCKGYSRSVSFRSITTDGP